MNRKLRDSLAGARSAALTVFFTLTRQATANRRHARKLARPLRALAATKRDRDLLPAIRHEDDCCCSDCIACRCQSDGEFGAILDGCPIHGATASEA